MDIVYRFKDSVNDSTFYLEELAEIAKAWGMTLDEILEEVDEVEIDQNGDYA